MQERGRPHTGTARSRTRAAVRAPLGRRRTRPPSGHAEGAPPAQESSPAPQVSPAGVTEPGTGQSEDSRETGRQRATCTQVCPRPRSPAGVPRETLHTAGSDAQARGATNEGPNPAFTTANAARAEAAPLVAPWAGERPPGTERLARGRPQQEPALWDCLPSGIERINTVFSFLKHLLRQVLLYDEIYSNGILPL